jgi:hypothetical protein
MASMAELARQLLGMNGNSVGGVSPDRYMEVMDRSPYATGVPLEIGYGEQDQMSPLDAAAMLPAAFRWLVTLLVWRLTLICTCATLSRETFLITC